MFVRHPRLPSMKCPPRRNGGATKSPSDKLAGGKVSPRRNGWQRSVLAMKSLATKCARDEMVSDEMVSNEKVATKRRRRKGGVPSRCTTMRLPLQSKGPQL